LIVESRGANEKESSRTVRMLRDGSAKVNGGIGV
jgi:hypothetical protein